MKLTSRDKKLHSDCRHHYEKLLYLWPILWPLFFFLIFRHHKDSDFANWFFVGVSIQIGIIALCVGIYTFLKLLIRRTEKTAFNRAHGPGAFSLIELLVVIAIIGVLASLVGPSIIHMMKGDSSVAATRQMLDDCGRARQMAIANRSTVYMVFVPTNFWNDPMRASGGNQWTIFQTACPQIYNSTTVTQLYAGQMNGYVIYSLRNVGDQPGAHHPADLLRVRTLPPHSFFSPIKFTWAPYSFDPLNPAVPFYVRPQFPMYGFLTTNALPFPTSDALTNTAFASALQLPGRAFTTMPYIAFNSFGQLTRGDGSLLPYDEYIPLEYGAFAPAKGQSIPQFAEDPPGNSTNISFTLIHIDRLTGRARIESQESL